jgi:D-psicose/D-tagatose/L-ribulose 3-epimerase
MKFGCCTNMLATLPDGTGSEQLEILQAIGYDYVELPLAQVMELPEAKFELLVNALRSSGIPCEACNNFFPARLRLTGPVVNAEEVKRYAEKALAKAAKLGAEVIVFGSAGAKNIPAGYAPEQAWTQLVSLLQMLDRMVAAYGIIIVIEPLNRRESNIVTTLSEGLRLMQQVERENIQLLVDFYHFALERESFEVVKQAGAAIRHVHLARPEGRVFPDQLNSTPERAFLQKLVQTGYDGRISIEAYAKNIVSEASQALKLLYEIGGEAARTLETDNLK